MDFHRIRQIVQHEHTLSPNEWKGAVLFLCNEEYVFFIKRSEKMPTHGGQIAFVGGHRQPDEENPWIVAEREFEEETGFTKDVIKFLGYLPIVMTAKLQPIVPVMGKLLMTSDRFLREVRSNGEWDDCIAYPWTELAREEDWEYAWRNGYSKSPVLFHGIRRGTYRPSFQDHHTHLLWGATASMVWDFLRLYYGLSKS
jgi:8-oxo-dGTP pyrophosphatase MutT (NUDIX family)